jgi:hypothetical protein
MTTIILLTLPNKPEFTAVKIGFGLGVTVADINKMAGRISMYPTIFFEKDYLYSIKKTEHLKNALRKICSRVEHEFNGC